MEALARYCSIPGYNKLCCESCSKRSGTFAPLLHEAAKTEEELRFGSASQLLETLSASVNGTLKVPQLHQQGSPSQGQFSKQTATPPPRKLYSENGKTQKRLKLSRRNLPAMTIHSSRDEDAAKDVPWQLESFQESQWPTASSEVERWRLVCLFFFPLDCLLFVCHRHRPLTFIFPFRSSSRYLNAR